MVLFRRLVSFSGTQPNRTVFRQGNQVRRKLETENRFFNLFNLNVFVAFLGVGVSTYGVIKLAQTASPFNFRRRRSGD